MANYPPPTEDLPIFDSRLFETNDIPLTIAEGSKYFLNYPVAQGKETLQAIDVFGIANFNNNCNFQAINPPTISSTIPTSSNDTTIATTSFVNTAISNAGNNGLVLLSTSNATIPVGTDQTASFANLFNSSYSVYRVVIAVSQSSSNTQFTPLQISAISGIGTIPTIINTASSTLLNGTITNATASAFPFVLSASTNQTKYYNLDLTGFGITAPASGVYSTIEVAKNSYSNMMGSGYFTNYGQMFVGNGISLTGFTLRISGTAATFSTSVTVKVYGYK